jgi:hypothetical protein
MKKTILTTSILAAGVLLLNGCTGGTDIKESNFVPINSGYTGSSSTETDYTTESSAISIEKMAEGFVLTWKKPADGYSEVIYSDDLNLARGRGYPLTANYAGNYSMPCEISHQDDYEMRLRCAPSNVSFTKGITLEKGVNYMWLVSDGISHEHGEVEATMLYNGESLIIE